MLIDVRRASVAEVPVVAAVLADAFADYPWTRWTVESIDHVERIEALQRLCIERIALPYGEVWVACDGGGVIVSVALWMRPDSAVPVSVLDEVGAIQATLEGGRHEAAIEAERYVAELRPTMPHYYLGAVGTATGRQCRGFGTAVLTPIIDRADTEEVPVFLETSTVRNLRFYQRLGFVPIAETQLPDGGPSVWALLRAPRSKRL